MLSTSTTLSRLPPAGHRCLQLAFASSSTASGSRRRNPTPSEGDDLVAPPDPVSNIRPIIYGSTPSRTRSSNSPYSASEFPSTSSRQNDLELEWRLRRERVDGMNHKFWSTMNTSFNKSMEYRLSLLPPPSDPPTEADIRRRDEALSAFYRDWQVSNQEAQIKWVKEWWRELWIGLKSQGKIYWNRALGR